MKKAGSPHFFSAGGTLSSTDSSYIARAADDQLFQALINGRYSFLLNSRQMGKSSLSVRVMSRLKSQGVQCVLVDLTRIGGKNVSPEQWYATLCREISFGIGLEFDLAQFWQRRTELGPMRRFFAFLREVVLTASASSFVLFLDEVDATQNLSFNTDEFFAGIREIFNRRAEDIELRRLTICLSGVALPSDLIADARVTPFNIGERIFLRDFSLEEVARYAPELGENGQALIERVHYWTKGHPFLTQSLCLSIRGNSSIRDRDGVDDVVRRELFEPNSKETNTNLVDVARRVLLASLTEPDPDAFRAEILTIYDRVLQGKVVPDDESNRACAILKLSGIVASIGGKLAIRNRVYRHVFDRTWVQSNMPDQEIRRQKRAYRKGFLLATAIGVLVALSIVTLALVAVKEARRADANAKRATAAAAGERRARLEAEKFSFQSYALLIKTTGAELAAGHHEVAMRALFDLERQNERGWELSYLSHQIHRIGRFFKASERRVTGLAFLPSSELVTLSEDNTLALWATNNASLKRSFRVETGAFGLAVPPSAEYALVGYRDGSIARISLTSGKSEWKTKSPLPDLDSVVLSGDTRTFAALTQGDNPMAILGRTADGKIIQTLRFGPGLVEHGALNQSGSLFAVSRVKKSLISTPGELATYRIGDDAPLWRANADGDQRVLSLEFDRNGALLASHLNGTIQKLASEDGRLICQWLTEVKDVQAVFPGSNDGALIVPSFKFVDRIGANGILQTRWNTSASILRATRSPDRPQVATTGTDGGVCIWETANEPAKVSDWTETVSLAPANTPSAVDGWVQLSPDGRFYLHFKKENALLGGIWFCRRVSDSACLWQFRGYRWPPAFSREGKAVALTHFGGRGASVLKTADGVSELKTATGFALALSADSEHLALGEFEKLKIYSVKTGKLLHEQVLGASQLSAGSFSEDGKSFAAGGSLNAIRIDTLDDTKPPATLYGHTTQIANLQFLGGTDLLSSIDTDGGVRLWDWRKGTPIWAFSSSSVATLSGHVFPLPGGKRLFVSTQAHCYVLDLATGRNMLTIPMIMADNPCVLMKDGSVRGIDRSMRVFDFRTEAVPSLEELQNR